MVANCSLRRPFKIVAIIATIACVVSSYVYFQYGKPHGRVVHTLYGDYTITEPVLLELLECPSMQRLKRINQYGVWMYSGKADYEYNRYDHSVGVMIITRQFGASLKEQAAALLHDVSHTVFSHVGDHLQQRSREFKESVDSYQDNIQGWYIESTEIASILERHGWNVEDVLDKNGTFLLLDQPAPDLCADRIEYNLHGGYLEKILSHEDVLFVLNSLRYKDGMWYFVNERAARLLATTSIQLTQSIFASAANGAMYEWAAQALCHAMDSGIITKDELHFSYDDVVWNRLCHCDDPLIQSSIHKIVHTDDCYKLTNDFDKADKIIKSKFRHVNPWVLVDGSYKRLSEIDQQFSITVADAREAINNGIGLVFLS